MVRVEPFIFQMVTAFKERLQLADKLNEVIDVLNDIEIDPEQIREIVETMLGDYYTKEEVDEIIASLPVSDAYTKSEVDTLLQSKADANNVYTKTEVDLTIDAIEGRLQTAEGDIDDLETDKANVSDVYTKSQVDTALSGKADSNNVYTKSQVDTALSRKANTTDVYTKTQVDNALSGKANTSDVYNKTQVDSLLTAKADASNVYTKSQVDSTVSRIDGDIAGKQDVLTAGTGITISNNVISATGGGGGGGVSGYKMVNHIRWSEYFTISGVTVTPLYDMILHIHYSGPSGSSIVIDKDIQFVKGRTYGNVDNINFYATRPDGNDSTKCWVVQLITIPYNIFHSSHDSETAITRNVNKWLQSTSGWDSRSSSESFTKNIDGTVATTSANFIELYYME